MGGQAGETALERILRLSGNRNNPGNILHGIEAPDHIVPTDAGQTDIDDNDIFGRRRCGCQECFTVRITLDGVPEIAQNNQKRIRNGRIIFNYMNTQDDSFSLEQLSVLNSSKCPSKIHQSGCERCTQ